MTTLKQLLEDLDIDTSDIDDGNNKDDKNEPDINNLKLDDIPEEQRPIFKKLKDTLDQQTNELAKRDLALKTMKDAVIAAQRTQPKNNDNKDTDNNEDDKVFGILPADDPYAPVFKKLGDTLDQIKNANQKDTEAEIRQNIQNFATQNPDMVQYAEDMDKLVAAHPTLINDIPTLYNMAKQVKEGRKAKVENKKNDMNRSNNARNHITESPGFSNANVVETKESKSIGEAFANAQESLSKRG
jgi:hypothetical protein